MELDHKVFDPSQVDKILKYQSKIQKSSIYDAIKELQRCSWDLEALCDKHSENLGVERRPGKNRKNIQLDEKSDIGTGSNQVERREKGKIYRLTLLFTGLISSVVGNCVRFIRAIIRTSVVIASSTLKFFSFEDPFKLNKKFIEDFENAHSRTHPEFNKYPYSVSLRIAVYEQRIMLVFVRDPTSELAEDTASKVICTEVLTNYVKTYNIIFYLCDTRSEDYKNMLNNSPFEGRLPILFICAPDPHVTGIKFHTITDLNFEGIVRSVDAAVKSSHPAVIRNWQKRKANEDNRLIREESEAAYRLSLEADSLRETKLKQKLIKKTEEDHHDLEKVKECEARRKKLSSSLQAEPTVEQASSPEFKDSIVRLKITLPSDRRIERRFWKNQTIGDLYDFVETQDLSPLKPVDKICLSSIYPPKSFSPSDRSISFEVSGLFPTGNIIVEENLNENYSYDESCSE